MFFLYYSTSSTSIDINADFYNTGETKHEKKKKQTATVAPVIIFLFLFFFVLFWFVFFLSEVKKLWLFVQDESGKKIN